MGGRGEIERVLAESGGVLVAREHPRLLRTANRLVSQGQLRPLAPGVFCAQQDAAVPEVLALAAMRWAPDAVLTGRAAAHMTYWQGLAVSQVTMSAPQHRLSRGPFVLTRETIPPELIMEVGPLRMTVPALTALDLALELGGEAIDRALRLGAASLDDMAAALNQTSGRRGNAERRRWLLDSRDEPWSEAEREGHRLLRAGGITGWHGNLPVACGTQLYFLDAAIEKLKIGIEIDGREFHQAENIEQFYTDRKKWTTLTLRGWLLLHFGANHVFDEGDWFLACVREAIATRSRLAG